MLRDRRPRLLALTALLAALALAAALPALAQEGAGTESDSFTVGGPVTAVDAAKRTITIGGPTGGTFEVDADATLMSGAQKLSLGDIKPGWVVDGSGDLRGAAKERKVITYLEEVDEGN